MQIQSYQTRRLFINSAGRDSGYESQKYVHYALIGIPGESRESILSNHLPIKDWAWFQEGSERKVRAERSRSRQTDREREREKDRERLRQKARQENRLRGKERAGQYMSGSTDLRLVSSAFYLISFYLILMIRYGMPYLIFTASEHIGE